MNKTNMTNPERSIRELLSVVLREYTASELNAPTDIVCRKQDFLICVLSGEATYEVDGNTVPVELGDVLYLSKGSVYRRTVADPAYLTMFIYFHFEREENEPPCYQYFPTIEGIESMFLKLYKKWTTRSIAHKSECMSLLYQLYSQLIRSELSAYLPKEKHAAFDEIVHLISENISEETISVSQLAAQAGMSEVHFRRCFKKIYKVSPQEFIVAQRLAHAKELLQYGEESIEEVAGNSGFSDPGYFSRLFKQKTGYTPTEYRKNFKSPA